MTFDRLADLAGISAGAVRTNVSRLRSDLDDDVIVTTSVGYSLDPEVCDATIAEAQIRRARNATVQQRYEWLSEALELWRGPSFADFAHEPWAAAEAARLDELAESARTDLAEALIDMGRHDEAIAELRTHIAASPLLDRSRRLLMTALAASGRTTEALREFQSYRTYLAEEMGTEPSAATIDLEQRILSNRVQVGNDAPHEEPAVVLDIREPSGPPATRAIVFTDVVASTELWEAHPITMSDSLRLHDTILRGCFERHGGSVFSNPGDGFGAVFTRPDGAARAACEAQEKLAAADWQGGPALNVRMGIHLGRPEQRDGNFFGSAVNLTARLCDSGHGGQIIVSSDLAEEIRLPTVSHGRYRLKGVHDPVELLQIGSDPFPPLRALDDRRTNLPSESTDLIGRAEERGSVTDALANARLVTVTGIGGVGKTRLARAVGNELLAHFDDGVWMIELARCRDLSSMLSITAEALKVPVPASPDRLAENLGGHDMLIILDNCEHVLEAAGEFADAMLSGSTRLRMLATSRERLGLDREQVLRLDTLASSDDALAIFRRRAAQVDVDLLGTDTEVLVEICDGLDRIPLAIELAAATCHLLNPQQILERLDQRFEMLRGSARRTARGRHESLRAAMDWSYDMLDEQQQTLLRRLSVFNGGFDVDAVEHVASDLDTPGLFLLGDLVDRSLVRVIPGPRNRYEQLETIRTYALQRSDELDEVEANAERHIRWCEDHVGRMTKQAFGEGEPVAIERLIAETSNLRAAVRRLVANDHWQRAADLVLLLDDLAYAANPLAELVGPLVEAGIPDDHPDRFRLLSIELIRRSTSDGTEGRAELATELVESISLTDPGAAQIPVLLIASAFGLPGDRDHLEALRRTTAAEQPDPAERARRLLASLLGTFYGDDSPKDEKQVDEAINAATTAGMRRLIVPAATAACIGGLSTLSGTKAIQSAEPILDHLDHLPLDSIMSSGLITSYTELAVASDAPLIRRIAALRRLGPTLQGDFNRVGLAMARLLQDEGHAELAVRTVGACDRSGRSSFSFAQIAAVLERGERALGADRVSALVAEGERSERSDLYRELWSALQLVIERADASPSDIERTSGAS